MQSEGIDHLYRRTWGELLLRGLISIAIGVFIVLRPLVSVGALALVVAVWAFAVGILEVIHAAELRKIASHWWLLLIGGLISIAFGIAALWYYPVLSLLYIVVWAAFWFLLSGIVAISISVQERRLRIPWVGTAIFGAVAVLAGIYAIVAPHVTVTAIIGVLAAVAIVGGCAQLFEGYRIGASRRADLKRLQPAVPG